MSKSRVTTVRVTYGQRAEIITATASLRVPSRSPLVEHTTNGHRSDSAQRSRRYMLFNTYGGITFRGTYRSQYVTTGSRVGEFQGNPSNRGGAHKPSDGAEGRAEHSGGPLTL